MESDDVTVPVSEAARLYAASGGSQAEPELEAYFAGLLADESGE